MTYCCALLLKSGLVFMSDTRTNAGIDAIATYRKMFNFTAPGERSITLLTAGNLATTQSVISLLEERSKAPSDRDPGLLSVPSMFQAARLVGETLREVIATQDEAAGQNGGKSFRASIILGGQIAGSPPRLFYIYPEGNFVEASVDTPFFQSGETKYGKPILVRAFDPEMTPAAAIKLLAISFASTIAANLGVDLPLDVAVHEADVLEEPLTRRIHADDPWYASVAAEWSGKLKAAVADLPDYDLG